MAVRHDARLRARHHVDRAQVHRLVRSPRRRRRARRILDAASTRRRGPHPAMSAWGLAWRTVARNPARAALAVSGVAVIGALLFTMLMLSRGLLVSLPDLLDTARVDRRVVSGHGS